MPLAFLLAAGCQQKMAAQPSYLPLRPSPFYSRVVEGRELDGRSARPLVPGTVPRGQPLPDSPLLTGLVANAAPAPAAGGPAAAGPGLAAVGAGPLAAVAPLAVPGQAGSENNVNAYVKEFPFHMTVEDVKRGQQRFTIFCTPCHSPLGDGNGKIVERGYLKPPNFHTDYSRGFERRGVKVLLRDAPVGYFFEVVSRGYGGMPDYAQQVPPADRWRIIAYVRALQFSWRAPKDVIKDLPAKEQAEAQQALEGKP